MTIYIDPLNDFGWKIYGKSTKNCHMFTDELSLDNLHLIVARIGLKRSYFQNKESAPHYDLTPSKREAAIGCGAVEVDWKEAVRLWKERRALLQNSIDKVMNKKDNKGARWM